MQKDTKDIEQNEELGLIQDLHLFLEYCDFETLLLEPSDENPMEQLFVSLSNEDVEEEDKILMHVLELSSALNGSIQNSDLPHMLQFYVKISGTLEDEDNLLELYTLLFELNNLLPLGSFHYDFETGVFFKYIFIINPDDYKSQTLSSIDLVKVFIISLYEKINSFVSNKLTLEECVNKIKDSF